MPALSKAVYEKVEIKWKQGDRAYSGPLVAYCALHCIKAVNSAQSRLLIEKISRDKAVHPKVAEDASEMLKY